MTFESTKSMGAMATPALIAIAALALCAGPALAACSATTVRIEVAPFKNRWMENRYNIETLPAVQAACQRQLTEFISTHFHHWDFVEAPAEAPISLTFSVDEEAYSALSVSGRFHGDRGERKLKSKTWVWLGGGEGPAGALNALPRKADLERVLCGAFIDRLIKDESAAASSGDYDSSFFGIQLKRYVPLGEGARWLNSKGKYPLDVAVSLSAADCEHLGASLFMMPAKLEDSSYAATVLSRWSGVHHDKRLVIHPCAVRWTAPQWSTQILEAGQDDSKLRRAAIDLVYLERYHRLSNTGASNTWTIASAPSCP